MSIIANIYGSNYPYICKDKKNTYIEVNDLHEARVIEDINAYQCGTFNSVKKLEEIVSENRHD